MKAFILIAAIYLSGCSYNGYNDPNILWPELWGVDNHAEKLNQEFNRPSLNSCAIYS